MSRYHRKIKEILNLVSMMASTKETIHKKMLTETVLPVITMSISILLMRIYWTKKKNSNKRNLTRIMMSTRKSNRQSCNNKIWIIFLLPIILISVIRAIQTTHNMEISLQINWINSLCHQSQIFLHLTPLNLNLNKEIQQTPKMILLKK